MFWLLALETGNSSIDFTVLVLPVKSSRKITYLRLTVTTGSEYVALASEY